MPFGDGIFDLVVSALALQFVNDLPGTLVQIRRTLKPDGLFLAALIGGETLTELRQSFAAAESEVEGGVSPRVAPFADLRDLGALLQRAGFALPVTDIDRIIVRYDSAFALMHDLRRMGATNLLIDRRRVPLRRATLMRMAEIYSERFSDADGRVRATFEIVWLSGWAPHPSQQQPLRPGSAKARLADALGTREISTGEKAGSKGRKDVYFNAVETVLNMFFTFVPRPPTTLTMATETPEAISAYSIAVAPRSSLKKRWNAVRIARLEALNMAGFSWFGITTASAGADQRFVGRRHRIVAQIMRPYPF